MPARARLHRKPATPVTTAAITRRIGQATESSTRATRSSTRFPDNHWAFERTLALHGRRR